MRARAKGGGPRRRRRRQPRLPRVGRPVGQRRGRQEAGRGRSPGWPQPHPAPQGRRRDQPEALARGRRSLGLVQHARAPGLAEPEHSGGRGHRQRVKRAGPLGGSGVAVRVGRAGVHLRAFGRRELPRQPRHERPPLLAAPAAGVGRPALKGPARAPSRLARPRRRRRFRDRGTAPPRASSRGDDAGHRHGARRPRHGRCPDRAGRRLALLPPAPGRAHARVRARAPVADAGTASSGSPRVGRWAGGRSLALVGRCDAPVCTAGGRVRQPVAPGSQAGQAPLPARRAQPVPVLHALPGGLD
mmetsp:Transcript_24244/g.91496  ORF Transcript_24244/g.91496 Transcript_24244/m.91496 type:complete len:301 (-) Transcript_24244:563-1465(-)